MTSQLPAPPPSSHYRSYLVRFWQSNDAGCWRASAQCVQSDSTVLFGNVASLLTFLQTEIQVSTTSSEADHQLYQTSLANCSPELPERSKSDHLTENFQ